MRTLILLTILSGFFGVSGYAQMFSSVGASYGMNFAYNSSEYIGGVSFADFDQDGKDDITFASGAGQNLYFYHNTSNGFELLSPLVNDIQEVKQVIWVDYDNDGDLDLYFTAVGQNKLYRNNGDLALEDVTNQVGFTDPIGTMSFTATWLDFDNNGLLDLFVAFRQSPSEGEVRLYKNTGNGNFLDVTLFIQDFQTLKQVFVSAAADINNDGYTDLLLGQVYGFGTYLLLNQAGDHFLKQEVNDTSNSHINTMTMTVADVDADMDFDFYVSDSGNGNSLEVNDGNGLYTDQSVSLNLMSYAPGWAAAFIDVDNDADLDMHLNSNYGSESYLQNEYSTFSPSFWGIDLDYNYNVALAVGDMDNDGYPDLVKSSPLSHSLWKNNGGNNHFLKVKLQGLISNSQSVGAKIKVYSQGAAQLGQVSCGENFCSQNSYTQFFGLGDYAVVDSMIVQWPSGLQRKLFNVSADQTITISELSFGCMDLTACNYDPLANTDDGSCAFAPANYDCDGNCLEDVDQDGICDALELPGCNDPNACNYQAWATDNDNSCILPLNGYDCFGACLSDSDNDGVCDEFEIAGCTDPSACNYSISATESANVCTFPNPGFDCNGNCLLDDDLDGICNPFEIPGCNDPDACNYNPLATDNDLTCSYLNYYTISGDTNPMDQIALTYAYTPIPGSFFNWTLSGGGDIIDGQGSPSITVVWNTPGAHTISVHEVTWMNCIGNDVSLNVNVIPNSVSEQVLNALDVYPNPANDLITLNNHSGDHFMIYDQTGNIIQAGFISTSSFHITSHEWPAGLYTIRVDDDGKQKTARVLIIH